MEKQTGSTPRTPTSALRRVRSTGTISRLATLISPTTVALEEKSTLRKEKEARTMFGRRRALGDID